MAERDEIAGLVVRLRDASAACQTELGAPELYGEETLVEIRMLKNILDRFVRDHG